VDIHTFLTEPVSITSPKLSEEDIQNENIIILFQCLDKSIKNIKIYRSDKMKEVYEFLKNSQVYYLATIDGDQPRTRPFGTVDLFEGKLYIQTGISKPVAKQMLANPKIEISAMYDGKWIRLAAEAVWERNIDAEAHMLAAYPSLQTMYKAGDGNTAVFYLKNAIAHICSFTEPVKEIHF